MLVLCGLYAVRWLPVLIEKYLRFGYHDWDLALASQAMWCLTKGSLTPSLYGTYFLNNHAEYIAFLLTPIYAVFPSPGTLLALKVLALSAAGFVFYLVAKEGLGRPAAFLLTLLYLFYPQNIFMLLHEFSFENLAVFFLMLLFYLFRKERWGLFTACCFLTALIKENIALVVFMFGFLALFTPRQKKGRWVLAPILIGGGIFFLSMFFIIPHLRSLSGTIAPNQYWDHYVTATAPVPGPAAPAVTRMWGEQLFRNLLNPLNAQYFRQLFLPLNVLPFLSPQVLILALPLVGQHVLTSAPQMKLMYFHYSASVLPVLFLAAACSLASLRRRPGLRALYLLLFAALTVTCGYLSLRLAKDPYFTFGARGYGDRLEPFRREVIRRIPPDAAVIASFKFLPQLSGRKSLYSFHKIWNGINLFLDKNPFPLPEEIQYAALDFSNDMPMLETSYETPGERLRRHHALLAGFFTQGDWKAVYAVEDIVLFEKDTRSGITLIEARPWPYPGDQDRPKLQVDQALDLMNVEIGRTLGEQGRRLLPLTFSWRSFEKLDSIYTMQLEVVGKQGTIYYWQHYIGYSIYPTILWKQGEHVRERVMFLLPDLPPGNYRITANISCQAHFQKRLAAGGPSGAWGNPALYDAAFTVAELNVKPNTPRQRQGKGVR